MLSIQIVFLHPNIFAAIIAINPGAAPVLIIISGLSLRSRARLSNKHFANFIGVF